MADVPAARSPSLSDDVEIEDILRQTQLPTVVVRKDSSCAAAAAATAARSVDDETQRLSTPAPIASFEVLSDVDESDMEDVTSLDVTLDTAAPATASRDTDDDVYMQANGSVELSPQTEQPEVDVTEPKSRPAAELTECAGSAELTDDIPRVVFEHVDDDKQTSLSSPECQLVNNNDVTADVADDTQQMWQWLADDQQGKSLSSLPRHE